MLLAKIGAEVYVIAQALDADPTGLADALDKAAIQRFPEDVRRYGFLTIYHFKIIPVFFGRAAPAPFDIGAQAFESGVAGFATATEVNGGINELISGNCQ